jgi:bacteriorhodopsin
MPFTAAQQAQGSSQWIWVAVVLLLLVAAAVLVATFLGIRLF